MPSVGIGRSLRVSILTINKTFRVGAPTWANACVGDNGNPQIFEYAAGFASAARSLLNTVIDDAGMRLSVDMLIYPICFSMRHATERACPEFCVRGIT